MRKKLDAFLKSDRQWPRHLRIAHAELQLSEATSRRQTDFWQAVLKANGAKKAKAKTYRSVGAIATTVNELPLAA